MQLNDTGLTLDGIKQDIYFLGKCDVNTFATGDLDRIINKYYEQLQEAVRSVNENFYMIVAVTDLVIGDGSYDYPDGLSLGGAPSYQKIKSIWAAYQPADITAPLVNEYRRTDIIDPDAISDPAFTFSPQSPKAMMFGDYFILLPLVTDPVFYPVTDGVKMFYIATIDKLVLDTDVPKIFVSFHDAIVQGSLIDVFKRLGDGDASKEAKVDFAKRLLDIKSYASAHIPDEISIVEGQDNQGGWEYPWGNNSMS